MSIQIMLGPQIPTANVLQAIQSLDIAGPIVSITAGWRDSEGETEDLQEEIQAPVEDLNIYHRAQTIFAHEPELRDLQRERQDKLVELQGLYRIRLTSAMTAASELMNSSGNPALLRLEQRAAISQVRALDRHHVRRIAAIHQEFDQRRVSINIPTAESQRKEVQDIVHKAGLVLITGGHVAVLLNRIRLFRLSELLKTKPIIAWSAGAMVLGERIVLFHDDAPQGARNAEVLDAGLGIVRNLIPLPHAKSRLDWSDPTRMAIFSRRFSPSLCCTLDSGSAIRIEQQKITRATNSSIMIRTGRKKDLVAR
jgi:peptidase E